MVSVWQNGFHLHAPLYFFPIPPQGRAVKGTPSTISLFLQIYLISSSMQRDDK